MEDFFIQLATSIQEPVYLYIITCLFFFFFGEPIILLMAFLASLYHILPPTVLIALAWGTAVVAEMLWFTIGHHPRVQKIFLTRGMQRLDGLMHQMHVHKPLPLLLITRLFTGLTIVAILYLSHKKLPWRSFLGYSMLVNAVWTPLVVLVGYTAGMGYTLALTIFESVHLALTSALVIALCIIGVYRLIGYFFLGKTVSVEKNK